MSEHGGYDSPISDKAKDTLGRWNFAREVYKIAKEAQKDWSVRVGVYGEWGSGKTSVLEFIKKMADSDGHFVVWFSPWGIGSADHIWYYFVDAIEKAIEGKGINLPKARRRALKNLVTRFKGRLKSVAKIVPEQVQLAGQGLSFLASLLKYDESDVRELKEVMGDKRTVILIDDLDRANPKIVPELLLAIREVFDVSGFSFVLAFDPNVVGAALREYHSGWDTQGSFLDKIIDFPRWLPTPSIHGLMVLAKSELARVCPNYDIDALERIFGFFPRNPRKVRTLVRHLWTVKDQIERFQEGEFQWELVYLTCLMTASWPRFFYHFSIDKDLPESFSSLVIQRALRDPKLTEKYKNHIQKKLEHLWKASGGDDEHEDKKRAFALAWAIGSRVNNFRDNIRNYSYLTEEPRPVTMKECCIVVDEWLKSTDNAVFLGSWMNSHKNKWNLDPERFAAGLIQMLLAVRDRCLNLASSVGPQKDQVSEIARAEATLEILQYLFFTDKSEAFLRAFDNDLFQLIFGMFSAWAHFINEEYQGVRRMEEEILVRVAEQAPINVSQAYSWLCPWHHDPSIRTEESKALHEKVLKVFDRKLLAQTKELFNQPGGIDGLHVPDNMAEFYLLLRRDSIFWESDNIRWFNGIVDKARINASVQDNMIWLFRIISSGSGKGIDPLTPKDIEPLAKDKDIMLAIWKGAVSMGVNTRIMGTLKEHRDTIQELAHVVLPLPVVSGVEEPEPAKKGNNSLQPLLADEDQDSDEDDPKKP